MPPDGGKRGSPKGKDGSPPPKKARVKPFSIDVDVVTNIQFAAFVAATGYITETEAFGWSFVLDSLASEDVIAEVDGETGYGRVKDAPHWMAVRGADWRHPNGPDSNIESDLLAQVPVLHVSYKDAEEYCNWAGGLRLPTEKEWEFAARGGRINESYPWGNVFTPGRMNIWDGDFPKENTLIDGYHGVAPVKSYLPNDYGLYNMLGNVWEWVSGGSPRERFMRGGSFVDSKDGSFNHAVTVGSRHSNAADSAANNIGFRCASSADDAERREAQQQQQASSRKRGSSNPEDTVTIEL
jgi:formylglycine-generating enzyme required for sulfatase activity